MMHWHINFSRWLDLPGGSHPWFSSQCASNAELLYFLCGYPEQVPHRVVGDLKRYGDNVTLEWCTYWNDDADETKHTFRWNHASIELYLRYRYCSGGMQIILFSINCNVSNPNDGGGLKQLIISNETRICLACLCSSLCLFMQFLSCISECYFNLCVSHLTFSAKIVPCINLTSRRLDMEILSLLLALFEGKVTGHWASIAELWC